MKQASCDILPTFYLHVHKDRSLKLTENSRKRSNLISVTIKLIWFLFGEMHPKQCYCTFYPVHVAFIDFKAEKTPEFFFERPHSGVSGSMYV